jgi:hypothetical protein
MAFVPDIVDNINKCDNYTTPLNAFQDLTLYKPSQLAKIYDPFYNDGKAKSYLEQVFPLCEVIHEHKDAFTWFPECDIIITNPPFSIKNKVLSWLMEMDKPFMLLLPINQICNKNFRKLKNFSQIQYIVPNGRYNFEFDTQKKSSSWFNCLWYCYKCNLPKDINYIVSP